ncbi:heavy metal RND efflux outer membrane protein, CzcC family [Nitratiruptor sp. YY08-26]|uniref:TolC family protein n=1 Tax=unclassified Nitratiruptor TaxID=2624044 RepID=UPI001916B529|nr:MULTISPECIES: TolC family protein [unclassified Nitratiruptor]BCD62286.1 heavy metal RND efflux outer membrane protein, CzcC family [Nitratiruptor sp. YY08-13]BCD66222.1 heavy metal RND efflux outer membrane protein, CzcC family [Nitratiruptor sp. YY08-26]
MRRAILLTSITVCFVFGANFQTFKQEALEQFPKLLQQKGKITIAKESQAKLLRPFNPQLELLGSRYEDGSGFETTLQIPYRLPDYLKDLKKRAVSEVEVQKAYEFVLKARFLKNLELLYTRYVYQNKLLKPIHSQIAIYKRLLSIAEEKYAKGYGKKIDVLKLQTKLLTLQKKFIDTQNSVIEAKMQLQRYAGFSGNIEPNGFLYEHFDFSGQINPAELVWYEKNKNRFLYLAKEQGHTIKRINFTVNYEKEPNSGILRAGISIPLPINKPKQEVAIAKMQANSAALDLELLKKRFEVELQGLQKQAQMIQKSLDLLQKTKKKQKELLDLYIESYKIDQSTLLDILDAQKAYISIEKEIVKKLFMLNLNQIQINYIKGRYND